MIIDTRTVDAIVEALDGTTSGTCNVGRLAENTKVALAVHIASRLRIADVQKGSIITR